jgi:hypothetical protein
MSDSSSVYRAHLSKFHLKTDRIQSLKHVLNKDRMMDNVQNCNSYNKGMFKTLN